MMWGVSSLLKLILLGIGTSTLVGSQSLEEDFHGTAPRISDVPEIFARGVSSLVREIVTSYMNDCYVILIRDGNSLISDSILRSLRSAYIAEVLVEVDMTLTDNPENGHLLDDLKRRHDKFTCQVILLDITSSIEPSSALLLLERMKLFLIPNASVVFLGSKLLVEDTLMNHVFRNTINVLFLAMTSGEGSPAEPNLGNLVKANMRYRRPQLVLPTEVNISKEFTSVVIYSRCLYCNGGQVGIAKIDEWNSKKGFSKGNHLFPDQLHDFRGHQVNIVSMDWYPMIDFTRNSDDVSATVTPQDSVDVRMLRAIAAALNFTYEMRVPWDNLWGTSMSTGNWTGTVGTLQHHKADLSMHLSWTLGRYQVIDYSKVYASESLVMVMSKPRPLPPYLALIRPLEGTLWVAVFLSSVCAGFILWALQWGWRITSGVRGLSLDRSILVTWSMLLEEPPKVIPRNISSQMFIGWWWVYCTLITVVYKSSLIAHLSIPAMSKPIDSFEELLEGDGWTWGYEPIYDSGWEWFKGNKNPTIKGIFQGMEVLEFEEQMDRVLDGHHVLISWEFIVKSRVAAQYTDKFGYSQIYIARTDSLSYGAGWGFRKNCPLLRPIDMAKQRLIETGFVSQWMNDLMGTAAARKTGKEEQPKETEDQTDKTDVQELHKEPQGLLILSVHHLQSVFFVLFLGFLGAFLAFIGENLIACCTKKALK